MNTDQLDALHSFWQFTSNDIGDIGKLAETIRNSEDALSQYIGMELLNSDGNNLLIALNKCLTNDSPLHILYERPELDSYLLGFYENKPGDANKLLMRFNEYYADMRLAIIEGVPHQVFPPGDLLRLNRLILEDAYPQIKKRQAAWTVMIYMAGDSNLSSRCVDDLRKLAIAGSEPGVVEIIVLVDRKEPNIPSRVLHILSTHSEKDFEILEVLPETDTGKVETLRDQLLRRCRLNYPADKYMLILWGHGGTFDKSPASKGLVEQLNNAIAAATHPEENPLPLDVRDPTPPFFSICPDEEDGTGGHSSLDNRKLKRVLRSFNRRIGSPSFDADDFLNLSSLTHKLRAKEGAIAAYLYDKLPPATQTLLLSQPETETTLGKLKMDLPKDFSALLKDSSLHEQNRFSAITLSTETRERLNQTPTGADLERLNRRLLEDAFPQEIARKPEFGRKLDILVLDACLLNTTELCYELCHEVKYTVGSETLIQLMGLPYETILPYLRKHPLAAERDVCRMFVTEFESFYSSYFADAVQLSACDMERMKDLAQQLDKLCDWLLHTKFGIDDGDDHNTKREYRHQRTRNKLREARAKTQSFHKEGEVEGDFIDLYDFCEQLLEACGDFSERMQAKDKLREICNDLKSIIDPRSATKNPNEGGGIVIANGYLDLNKDLSHTYGLSIYFPRLAVAERYQFLDLAVSTRWGKVLSLFFKNEERTGRERNFNSGVTQPPTQQGGNANAAAQ